MRLNQVLRRLARMPLFTSVAVLTLAIGIGANAAVFSVIEGVLLKPLPYPRSDELVALDHSAPGVNLPRAGAAPFLYFTYREEGRVFQDVGLWNPGTVSVTGLAEPEEVPDAVRHRRHPAHARRAADARASVHEKRRLARRPRDGRPDIRATGGRSSAATHSAIGRTLMVDSRPGEIIGVLPDTFRFLDRNVSIVMPFRFDRSKVTLGQFSFRSIARLKPGATIDQATADMARMLPMSLTRFPPPPGANVKMFEEVRLGPLVRSLKDDLVGDVKTVLWVLMGTIGMVFLIACANVANLLLVRAESRQQELADSGRSRRRLGTDRSRAPAGKRHARPHGGIVGLGLAFGALRLLVALAPGNLPRLEGIGVDLPVLALHARTVRRCRSAVRRHSGVQVRTRSARPLRFVVAGGLRARAGNVIARATRSSSRRSRWRSCCSSAPG